MKKIAITFLILLFTSDISFSKITGLSYGADNSKINLKVYSSLTCPHCAEFHFRTLPKLIEAYASKNMMYIEILDFPLDYPALNAAKIQKCVNNRQDEYLDIIYKTQSKWANAKNLDEVNNNLKQISTKFGISSSDFDKCLTNKNIEKNVLQSRINAQKNYNVNSTPTIVINKKKYSGPLEFDELKIFIDKLL